jgi:hypothetical protein
MDDLGMPMPKRVGPDDVPPVVVDNMRFEVIHWGKDRGLGQNGGYIAAIDDKTNVELWVLRVYEIQYDQAMEEDVQDLFIQSLDLAPEANTLKITDENNKVYWVDTNEKTVREE